MARDWAKQRGRDAANKVQRDEIDMFQRLNKPWQPAPSKAAMQAEAKALIADYCGKIKRIPPRKM